MNLEEELKNKRILVTQANDMMGPAVVKVFRDLGAIVTADPNTLEDPAYPEKLIRETGIVDVLVIGTGINGDGLPADKVTDEIWKAHFSHMVDPLPRLARAVLPQMLLRKSGKIILMGSAAALKGIPKCSAYSAARGAQLSYIQALGVELAPYNIQVNALAQNFVRTEMYYPEEIMASDSIQSAIKHTVPLGRAISPMESAYFVAYLASSYADCFVGQVFPLAGGWTTR